MGGVWAFFGALLAGLLAQLETAYLSYIKGKQEARADGDTAGRAQVDAALALKRRLDAADACAVERLRAWGRHALAGRNTGD